MVRDASIGIGSGALAFGVTLTQFEQGVRVAGGVAALTVAVLTIVKIGRDLWRGK